MKNNRVRFFQEPITIPNAIEQAKSDPEAFILFIKIAFEKENVKEGKHPLLDDLIVFCNRLNDEAYNEPIQNPNIVQVLDAIKPLLVTHYQGFAKTNPETCAERLKIEMHFPQLIGKKHSILGNLKPLYEHLPEDNLVYQFLQPLWVRAHYLELANTAPDTLITLLEADFDNDVIQSGQHPCLGSMLSFAYDIKKHNRYSNNENKVTAFLKSRLFKHYHSLAQSNPSLCVKHIEEEDALRHFKSDKHLIFSPIDSFIDTLKSEKTKSVKETLIKIKQQEALAIKAIHNPGILKEAFMADIESEKIKGYMHEEYGDLRILANKIQQDSESVILEGKHPVLAFFETIAVWSYPPAHINPIIDLPYNLKKVDPRQAAIDTYQKHHRLFSGDAKIEDARQAWIDAHYKGTVRIQA